MEWHRGKTVWFTGLSGSGKSTMSSMVMSILKSRGVPVVLLDGDMIRSGLNRDLGFSAEDRGENLRRAGEVAKILCDAGHTVLAAFITPLESLRVAVRGVHEPDRFVEVFLDCSLEVCESRDPKGLYCRARSGEIQNFTGISAPFDPPSTADVIVPTDEQTVEESLNTIMEFLETTFSDLRLDCSRTSATVLGRRPRKVFVIGLDGAPASLVFGEAGKQLSNLRALKDHGCWGPLKSTDPPITVPAWTTMTTGRDPGELGLYGFRNRRDRNYDSLSITTASAVEVPRVWDYIEATGKTSVLLGIPQTYPPKAHRGLTVAGFLAPDVRTGFTYPSELADELDALAGGSYLSDVRDFRTQDKERLLNDLYRMTERRFRVARDFAINRPWDFFMMVEIALDRLHHGFWRFCQPDHPAYEPGNRFESVLSDFYRFVDDRIGALIALLGDETTVMVVSDHGARSMTGGVCINEWLMRNGYLTLRREPDAVTPLTPEMIDWSKTSAWSEGGYYARIFINVKGREPHGVVTPEEYETFRDTLADNLTNMSGQGRAMNNQVLKPEDLYRECRGLPPDLMVYFDDLNYRSIGSVGHGRTLLTENDTGPDDANHDPEGIFISTRLDDLRHRVRKGKKIEDASCLDITPTLLNEFGLTPPGDLGGRILPIDGEACSFVARGPRLDTGITSQRLGEPAREGYTTEEEEIIRNRLEDLGYL